MNKIENALSSQESPKEYRETKKKKLWTDSEKIKFNEALRMYGKDWESISEFIGTKSNR